MTAERDGTPLSTPILPLLGALALGAAACQTMW
jgi:hypothetical protein